MDKETNGADLSGASTAEAATEDMGGAMSRDQFADWLMTKGKAKAEPEETATTEQTEETATETAEEPATDETAGAEASAEGDTTEGQEQPEEQPEAAEDEVLSKSDSNKPDKLAKWQEKTQKRIDELTARAKAAEERAAMLEAQVTASPEEAKTVAEPVMISDPDDRTATVLNESELDKLTKDAENVLEFISGNELAIQRALLKEQETVIIGDTEYPLAALEKAKREAKRHLEKHIPQRRDFLKLRQQNLEAVKQLRPSLVDKRSPEYQELQAIKRRFPALNSVPTIEAIFAYMKIGMEKVKADQEAQSKPAVKPAAATPPKSAADTAAPAAPVKKTATGEKAKIKAQLDKAEKEYKSTGSKASYARVLELQGQLKRIS